MFAGTYPRIVLNVPPRGVRILKYLDLVSQTYLPPTHIPAWKIYALTDTNNQISRKLLNFPTWFGQIHLLYPKATPCSNCLNLTGAYIFTTQYPSADRTVSHVGHRSATTIPNLRELMCYISSTQKTKFYKGRKSLYVSINAFLPAFLHSSISVNLPWWRSDSMIKPLMIFFILPIYWRGS